MLVKPGPTASTTADDGEEIRSWAFEVVELYKGQPKTQVLWSKGSTSTCGAYLDAGNYYVVSPGDDGSVSNCSVSGGVSAPADSPEIQILRAHKDGEIPELTEPWYFWEDSRSCALSHKFASGRGHLKFFFRYREPESMDSPQASHRNNPSLEPGYLRLSIYFGGGQYIQEGSGRLSVAEQQWRMQRAVTPPTWPYEHVIDNKVAVEVLAALGQASTVSIVWRLRDLPHYKRKPYPDYPDARAQTSVMYLTDGISDFRQCIGRAVIEGH